MKRKVVHIDINMKIYEDLKIYCIKKKITIKELVRELVVKHLKRSNKCKNLQ